VSGTTTISGGAGKIIGGGRGIGGIGGMGGPGGQAITVNGMKTINAKNNILIINFFIRTPPFV
jgi:hypothetical protein